MAERSETLNELALRCETASGPDEQLDQEIANLLWQDQSEADPRNVFDCYQPYSAALDAAVTLLPEGSYSWAAGDCGEDDGPWATVTFHEGRCPDFAVSAATVPLALTAACLRALASQGDGE